MIATITLTFGLIWVPIIATVILAAIAFWPRKGSSPGHVGLGAMMDGIGDLFRIGACTIVALIVWIVYLALT